MAIEDFIDSDMLKVAKRQAEVFSVTNSLASSIIKLQQQNALLNSNHWKTLQSVQNVMTEHAKPFIKMNSALGFLAGTSSILEGLHASIPSVALDFQKSTLIAGINAPVFASIIETSRLFSSYAEKALSSFAWENLGQAINITQIHKKIIGSKFINLSKNYYDLYKSYEERTDSELNSSLIKFVPAEYYKSADLLEIISISDQDKKYDETEINAKEKIDKDSENVLQNYLPQVGSNLLNMWHGAVEALSSKNIEKTRHFSVSIRELFTQVLHTLAPDKELFSWSKEPNYFQNGRPTREARLKYIYRNLQNEQFNKFIDSDIKATIAFINTFQEGTHSPNNPFTEKQLYAIKSKAEATLSFLLRIYFQQN